MKKEEIGRRFEEITIWRSGDQRAPHKPLLLLYALAKCSRGEARLIPYRDIDPDLRSLLIEFGPSRKAYHTEYPFWRLQNDGIWMLTHTDKLERRQSSTDAKKSELLKHDVAGGFTEPIYNLLQNDQRFLSKLAAQILEAHFPASMHGDILGAVGLDLEDASSKRRKRDAEFRTWVLRAYEYRCAVCGFDVRIDQMTIGLEAAHMKWHLAGGPDIEENGVALCVMHHKLLDFGAYRITEDYRVRVSQRVHGTRGLDEWLLRFHDQPVRKPQSVVYTLKPEYLTWHVREVFKTPERHL